MIALLLIGWGPCSTALAEERKVALLSKMEVTSQPIEVLGTLGPPTDRGDKLVYIREFDLGEVPYSQALFVHVRIGNDSASELEIGSADLSCSCLAIGIKDPNVPVGGELDAMLKLKAGPGSAEKRFRHDLVLGLSKDENVSLQIIVRGSVKKPLQLLPVSNAAFDGSLQLVAIAKSFSWRF